MTTRWNDVCQAAPQLAQWVQARFAPHEHHVLATLRADGSPRVSGIEVDFAGGEVWLGMIWHSRKALDLRRDPRCAVHVNPGAGADALRAGDARLSGVAVEVHEGEARAAYVARLGPPHPFHLFRIDVHEVTRTWNGEGTLQLQSWRPGPGLRTFRPHEREAPAAEPAPGGGRRR